MITKVSISFLMAHLICSLTASAQTKQKCQPYEPEQVTLTGRISIKVFPGRPNYESVKAGDEPEPAWLLRLTKPICVVADKPDDLNEREDNVTVVHLVLKGDQFKQLRRIMKSVPVTVTGTLFHSHTGHHHAKVLMMVTRIPAK